MNILRVFNDLYNDVRSDVTMCVFTVSYYFLWTASSIQLFDFSTFAISDLVNVFSEYKVWNCMGGGGVKHRSWQRGRQNCIQLFVLGPVHVLVHGSSRPILSQNLYYIFTCVYIKEHLTWLSVMLWFNLAISDHLCAHVITVTGGFGCFAHVSTCMTMG